MRVLQNRFVLWIAFLLVSGLVRGASSPAADAPFWPRFHGPKEDNISTDTGLLKKWPDEGPKLLWKADKIGTGYAGVTLAGGLIYTAGNIGDKTVITALDLDGRILWQVENGQAWTESHSGTRGTPTIDGDRLYHESPLGEVVCLEAKTGKKIWGLNILEKFQAKNIRWALAESLLVDGDRLICCPGGPKTAVVALNKTTGQTVWQSPSAGDAAGYCSPTLAECKGLRMILTLSAKQLIAVNADNGDLLWQFPKPTSFDVNVMSPIYHDGQVFVSTGYRSGSLMLKVNVEGKKATVEKLWDSKELDNHHGGVLLVSGYLYGAAHFVNKEKWVCLDWQTGKKLWAETGVGKGSATYADGLLYTLSEKWTMGLAKVGPNGFELLSRFKLPPGVEGPSWAHPVLCGGRLYIRHDKFLYAYDVRAQ